MGLFDDLIPGASPRLTRGSTFGDQNGPGSDSGDNGQFAYGGSSVNNSEDYAALPVGSGVPPGYKLPVLNPQTGDVVWVTHRDKGPAKWTGRGVDLAPSAMQKLGATTDDPLVVDTGKAFNPQRPFDDLIPKNKPAQAPTPTTIPTYAAQQAGPEQPEGSVFTDRQARSDLVANVKQGLKDFIPTLKQGVATTVPRNRQELVDSVADVTRQAAAPYEESMYKTVGPEKYDQPALDLADPYAMVPGIPPGLIPELAKIKGPIGDYIRSQVEATPKHEPSGYERFGQAALGAASQLTTPHSAADIYSFKTPGAQQAFAAERVLSTPEQAARVKQTYDERGLPEAAATGLNEAIMDILPALHDAGKLKEAGQYADLLPTPEAKPSIEQAPGQVYFQPGDAEATAQRTQGAGQQISPEHLQAIAQALGRRDTGLPNLEGEAGSPNRILEDAIEKALRRTTLSPLRSATDIANANKTPVPQLDEKSNDAIIPNVQRPVEAPLKPEKEPAQGAETDLAPAGMENAGTVERQNVAPVGNAPRMERPGQPETGVEAGQDTGAETLAGQINTETGRAERGLDPREEVLRREFGKSVELAQKKEANNPGAGRRLVDRLEKSPKAVNDPDHVLLARQVIQAQNEYDQAAKEVAANPDDKEAQHAADIADARIQKAYQAYDNAGTGTARGLAIRNVLKAHDYTLPAMQARFRTKVGDLTAAQAREIKGIHERITAAENVLGPEAKMYAGLDPEDVKKAWKQLELFPTDRNFQKWFRDSKVTNDKGKPLVVYHGTGSEFSEFRNGVAFFTDHKPTARSYADRAVFNDKFSGDLPDDVSSVDELGRVGIEQIAEEEGIDLSKGKILPTYLRIEKPLDLTDMDANFDPDKGDWDKLVEKGILNEPKWDKLDEYTQNEVMDEYGGKALWNFLDQEGHSNIQKKGYDGVIFNDVDTEGHEHRSYAVFDPHQVKHATKNSGEYSTTSPNIFYAGLDPEDMKKSLRRAARMTKTTEDYQKRTKAEDISPRNPRTEPERSAVEQKALYEKEKAKADFHSMIERVKYEQKSPAYRGAAQLLSYPRRLAVAGHGIVFPITHAGDLLLRPASWGTFGKGFLRTYAATFNKGFHDASMGHMMASTFKNGENAFHLATASKVDVGIGIGGAGLVKGEGMAGRAWDALKVMRFELWKNQMEKVMRKNPSLSYAEKLEAGKELASWANHATGSGKGLLADSKVGQSVLFGPKLTQSKLNKLSIDPAKTIATFANWKNASLGDRTAAKVRLSGAVQYATTLAGFLIGNAAILQAMGSKQKINLTDPNKTDFWSFKIAGTDIAIPGLHSEMRYLAQILATTVASRKDLRGESRQGAIFDKGSQYLRSKLSPTAQLVAEGATRQDYRGRPLPFSNEKPTKFLPKYSYTEYATSKAPIPLTGPGKYIFDQMRDKGMSATDAAQTTQALTIFGLGLTGMHVHEDYPEKPKKGH